MREVYPVNELVKNDLNAKIENVIWNIFARQNSESVWLATGWESHRNVLKCIRHGREGEIAGKKLRRTIGRNLSPLPWRTPGFQLFQYLVLNWFLKRNTGGQRNFISRNTTLKDSLTNDVLHLMKININITSISNLFLGRLGTISPSNRSLAFHSINALRLVRDDANLPRSFLTVQGAVSRKTR